MAVSSQRKIIQSVAGSLLRIGSGTALSNAFKLEFDDIVGVYFPSGWDAASLGFQVSHDGVTFVPARDQAGAVIAVTVNTDTFGALPVNLVTGGLWVKLWSVTAATGASVNQTANRDFKIVTQPIDA